MSINFKNMIHAIHAAELRQGGLVIIGFGGGTNDFTNARIPNPDKNLIDCETCRFPGTYELQINAFCGF